MNIEKAFDQFEIDINLSVNDICKKACVKALLVDYVTKMGSILCIKVDSNTDQETALIDFINELGIPVTFEEVKLLRWLVELIRIRVPDVWTVPYVEALCFLLYHMNYVKAAGQLVAITNEFTVPVELEDSMANLYVKD